MPAAQGRRYLSREAVRRGFSMHTGGDLQRRLVDALAVSATGRGVAPVVLFQPHAVHGEHGAYTSLTEVLRSVYPVVNRLVGDDFFDYLAEGFLLRAANQDVHELGRGLAEFLERFPPAAELGYLADVARLEWACHHAAHGDEHAPLDPATLAAVRPERYADLRFRLHPSSHVISSPYPVLRIWEVNQELYSGNGVVDLDAGGCRVLVRRNRRQVELHELEPAEERLLRGFAEDRTLAEAWARAQAAQPGADLARVLLRHLVGGTLVGFSI